MDEHTVFLVEDDQSVRTSLVRVLEAEQIGVQAYAGADELLDSYDKSKPGVLVVDLFLPTISGIELCDRLRKNGDIHPFIIISGRGRIPDAKLALWKGAMDFMEKPLDMSEFLDRVRRAFVEYDRRRQQKEKWIAIQKRLDSLTHRESEVLEFVADGVPTKQIANRLGISTKTVENHRSNITKKMKVGGGMQLVRLVTEFRMNDSLQN